MPARAAEDAQRLREVVDSVLARAPDLPLTVDLVENRGFEYHIGLCFTLFARGVRGELGRGGRYLAGGDFTGGAGEPATGFTLYTDTILSALPPQAVAHIVFVPLSAPPGTARSLRQSGWSTLGALAHSDDPRAEAKRLGCTHVWTVEKTIALEE